MLKRFIVATLALALTAAQVFAAGSLSLSLSQQFDSQGRPLSGGKFYTFQTGTSTPQSAFQDTALTIAYPNPITLDSSGRIPPFYLADGTIKIRLADVAGVTILAYDGLLVIGPSSGGGGGASVDATTVLATGDVKPKYGTGSLTGFVRLNGRTIGSATSGATERANADVQTLFEYLWTADANLAVSGGRGGSANADWGANKTIALPDFRGRAPAALDDMGNSAAGRLTSSFFGASAVVLGNAGGGESKTLVTGNLPAYTPAGSLAVALNDPGHTHGVTYSVGDANGCCGLQTSNLNSSGSTKVSNTGTTGITVSSQTFTGTAQGGTSTAFNLVQPTILITYYIKL
jgi:microcystin-dependent protein